jgi:hypothetical protein
MPAGPDFHEVLRELAHQQAALSQQQTALLQLQSESLRLQRLLIERAMGGALPEVQQPIVTTSNAYEAPQEPAVEPPHVGQDTAIAPDQAEPSLVNASPPMTSLHPATRPLESRSGATW